LLNLSECSNQFRIDQKVIFFFNSAETCMPVGRIAPSLLCYQLKYFRTDIV
jgi:hypothetical protein